MKKITLLLLIISTFGYAQNTYVPDDNFEQELIDLGFDSGPLDDYVPTANINTEWTLNLGFKGINDLTGIEDFTELRTLYIAGNNLTSLDLSNNLEINQLNCLNNNITSLDLTLNTKISNFNCNGNDLTSLNIKNGNNVNMSTFFATNNPNLTCITVDDENFSNTNWTNIDSQTSFSNDCSTLSTDDFQFENSIVLYPNPAKNVINVISKRTISAIHVFSVLGEKVAFIASSNRLNISHLQSGMYLVKLVSDEQTATKKMIVE